MKITDEMVERAIVAQGYGNNLSRYDARRILEAALKDVPEPDSGFFGRAAAKYLSRAEAAEAKLARLQLLVDCFTDEIVYAEDIREILEGK